MPAAIKNLLDKKRMSIKMEASYETFTEYLLEAD